MTNTPNTSPGASQDWLDRMLSEPPVEVPDEGFTKHVVARIRTRKRARIFAIMTSAAMGLGLAVVLGAADGLIRMIDILTQTVTPERFSFLSKLPLPELPQMPQASDFSSPLVLALIVVTALIWFIREEA